MKRGWKRYREYFLPTEKNGHKPRLFSDDALLVLSSLLVFSFVFSLASLVMFGTFSQLASVSSTELVRLTNTSRSDFSRPVLAPSPILEEAAERKLAHMEEHGYFDHTAPDGTTPWSWLDRVGYNFAVAGENLAMDFTKSESINRAWLNSPTHRENILNIEFTEIGIAAKKVTFNGKETFMVVQLFGRPQAVTPAAFSQPDSNDSLVIARVQEGSPSTLTNNESEATTTVSEDSPDEVVLGLEDETGEETVRGATQSFVAARSVPHDGGGPGAGVVGDAGSRTLEQNVLEFFSLVSLGLAGLVTVVYLVALVVKPELQHVAVITRGTSFVFAALSLSYLQFLFSEFFH